MKFFTRQEYKRPFFRYRNLFISSVLFFSSFVMHQSCILMGCQGTSINSFFIFFSGLFVFYIRSTNNHLHHAMFLKALESVTN